MWQGYALGSLIAGALESVADKAGIVHDARIDSYVATFYRVSCYLAAVTLLGFSGLFGELQFFFHWTLPLLGVLATISSLLFTYLLRRLEITVIGALAYVAPIVFLCIDTAVIGVDLSGIQILGILFLVGGAIAFVLDGVTHHFRRIFTWRIAGALFLMTVVYAGADAYLFKYLHSAYQLSAVSYSFSTHLFNVVFLFGIVVARGSFAHLFDTAAIRYLPYAAIGKSFDAVNTIFYLLALPLVSVSQLTAFTALSPLVLFLVAALTQGLFRFSLQEHLRAHNAPWKLGAAIVLVVGGLMVG